MATSLLEKAVALDSSFATAQATLARIYANDHFNNLHGDEPRLQQALEAARKALELAPTQPQGHLAMGYYHYYGSRDYDRALEEFAQAAERQPNDSEMYEAMGYVLRRQGRWEQAAEKLERSVELDPASAGKLTSYLETLLRMRRFDDAERWIERGLEAMPDQPQIYMLRALLAFMKGDLAEATSIMGATRQRYDLEQLREFETQLELASRNYESALATAGNLASWAYRDTVTYYSTKALIYHLMGDTVAAHAYYDSTRAYAEGQIAKGVEKYQLYGELAQARAYLGDREGALRAMERAEEIMPMSRDALAGTDVVTARAVTNIMLGNEDAAIDDLEFLLKVPSNLTRAWLRVHPGFDSLRDNPRFQQLMQGRLQS
jgi:serine/threonine-protein kinase